MNKQTFNAYFRDYVKENTFRRVIKDNKIYYYDKLSRIIGLIGYYSYKKLNVFDQKGNLILTHDSDGNWEKRKYENGSIVLLNNSTGTHWVKKNKVIHS